MLNDPLLSATQKIIAKTSGLGAIASFLLSGFVGLLKPLGYEPTLFAAYVWAAICAACLVIFVVILLIAFARWGLRKGLHGVTVAGYVTLIVIVLLLLAVSIGIWGIQKIPADAGQPAVKPPALSSLTFRFVPDKAEGTSIFGRVTVQNDSSKSLQIGDTNLLVSSSYFDGDTKGHREVPPGQSTEFPVDHRNNLALRGGDVTLQFGYAFDGIPKPNKPAAVTFTVPRGATLGKPIPPTRCCEQDNKDLFGFMTSRLTAQLDLDDSFIEVPEMPEIDGDGKPTVAFAYRDRRRFKISVPEHVVYLASYQLGAWRELRLPLGSTPNQQHYIKASWNDERGLSYLIVDDAALGSDANTGKIVRVPAQEMLEHGL